MRLRSGPATSSTRPRRRRNGGCRSTSGGDFDEAPLERLKRKSPVELLNSACKFLRESMIYILLDLFVACSYEPRVYCLPLSIPIVFLLWLKIDRPVDCFARVKDDCFVLPLMAVSQAPIACLSSRERLIYSTIVLCDPHISWLLYYLIWTFEIRLLPPSQNKCNARTEHGNQCKV
jgi:hypothetical protein